MKLSSAWLLQQSVTYAFSRKFFLFFTLIGIAGSFLLTLFYEAFLPLYTGVEYWYEFLQTLFSFWWYLVVGMQVLCLLRGSECPIGSSARGVIKRVVKTGWLCAWLTLLQWAMVPLLQKPYLYSESVDLLLFLGVACLLVLQLFLSFFMIPAIAGGEYSFKKLFLKSFESVRRYFLSLLVFFSFILLLWGALIITLLLFDVLLRLGFECFIVSCWPVSLTQGLILATANGVIATIVGVAQTIFYESRKEEYARW
ncbi:MAG: hypothetical protein UV38_C0004G0020 [candidate division TM6 bacterium GW2011_GWE2_42_60]|nr:MAG: hypothetical protein UV38_C0004G0020 [candidate division TM6 bacterium GW2011_GWE2_42_60]HBY05897.1 hypothetical protein [Candidatus Dependentiae bacterium]